MLLLYMVQARGWKGELGEAERLAETAEEIAALLDEPHGSGDRVGRPCACSRAPGLQLHACRGT